MAAEIINCEDDNQIIVLDPRSYIGVTVDNTGRLSLKLTQAEMNKIADKINNYTPGQTEAEEPEEDAGPLDDIVYPCEVCETEINLTDGDFISGNFSCRECDMHYKILRKGKSMEIVGVYK